MDEVIQAAEIVTVGLILFAGVWFLIGEEKQVNERQPRERKEERDNRTAEP